MKNTVSTFKMQKENKDKITMLTAYDYSTAKLIDEAGVNGILVGDSLGMVMLGYEDTLSVTMELEGGESVCPQIKAIVEASIPVMAHIGLTPQSVNAFGGFKVQGKSEEAAKRILQEAKAVEKAGAFAVVLECIPDKLAKIITEEINIPTIGIGAGSDCDGQILVYQDMLGMFGGFKPKFVKRFANVGEEMTKAFKGYIEETKAKTFPAKEHCFKIDDSVIEKLY